MKRAFYFCLVLLILGSVSAFAAGSKASTAPSGPVTIEFFQQKLEEGPQQAYKAVLDKFSAAYPQYHIEINTVPQAGQVLTSRIVAGDIPPLFSDYPTQLQFKEKVKNGFIYDLTGQSFLSRINKPALDLCKQQDGHDYAMPLTQNFMGVYYNIDIFNANGISIPTSYDELIAACKKLKANGVQPFIFSFIDPGRVGHMFQAWNAAWTPDGVERMAAVMNGTGTIANDPVMLKMAQRILEMVSYGNADAFSLPDMEGSWAGFANGKAAMLLMGSYARGTLLISNPNIHMGVFPLPGDTDATTTVIAGIDAALCIAAGASAREKEAALAYLEFLSRAENAQIFCNIEGAPNCVTAVDYPDKQMAPIIEKVKRGPIHDWFAASFPGNVMNAIYSDAQQFLMDKDPSKFLAQLQQTIINESK